MAIPDYYQILHVDPSAPPDTIISAYIYLEKSSKLQAKKVAPYRLAWIREAYAVLSDPVNRSHYDLACLQNPLEPGRFILTLDELYQHPSYIESQRLTRRNKRIFYIFSLIFAICMIASFISGDMGLAIFVLFCLVMFINFARLAVNLKSDTRINKLD